MVYQTARCYILEENALQKSTSTDKTRVLQNYLTENYGSLLKNRKRF
jgi:hypothetical protein